MLTRSLTRGLVKSLSLAIETRDVNTVRTMLLKNPEMVHFSSYREKGLIFSPLGYAVEYAHPEMVQLIIDLGANANEKFKLHNETSIEWTNLQLVSYLKDDLQRLKIGQILIKHGADVNVYSNSVPSPLQIAITRGSLEYTDLLLKNGARLKNGPEWHDSEQPIDFLLLAPKNTQRELLQLLIKYGLDLTLCSKQHVTDYLQYLMIIALDRPHKIDVLGITRVLINYGLSANGVNREGSTTLSWAIRLSNFELVSILIKNGANVNKIYPNQKIQPIHWAARVNNEDITSILLTNGADPNAKTVLGDTALKIACYFSHEKQIKILLQKGASINVEDRYGKIPFYYLKPDRYNELDVPSINLMLKAIAKLKFSDHHFVLEKNMELIHSHPEVERIFYCCIEELNHMSSFKFYACYSYYHVLNIPKNSKKLANLAKNEEFVAEFRKNLHKFRYYGNDLQENFDKAVQVKHRSLILETRLKSVFANSFPDVVLRKLASHLTIEDLNVQAAAEDN